MPNVSILLIVLCAVSCPAQRIGRSLRQSRRRRKDFRNGRRSDEHRGKDDMSIFMQYVAVFCCRWCSTSRCKQNRCASRYSRSGAFQTATSHSQSAAIRRPAAGNTGTRCLLLLSCLLRYFWSNTTNSLASLCWIFRTPNSQS